jgi:hypothetical protein
VKLWMVIYLAGQIVGTVGPLPYDEPECVRRVVDKMAGADHSVTTPEGYTIHDVRLVCEWHDERPSHPR